MFQIHFWLEDLNIQVYHSHFLQEITKLSYYIYTNKPNNPVIKSQHKQKTLIIQFCMRQPQS